jgi:serine-type D-Ala-D-Ala carboxypeptidase/endopeptidase
MRHPMFVVAAILWLMAPVATQAVDRKPAVDALVQPLLENGDLVGAVVGVMEDGKTQVFSYGRRAAGNPQPPDASTVFEVGSVTKAFTGLALAIMVDRKMVALDDPVRELLPPGAVPPPQEGAGAEITLLDLATQSSGLPRMPSNFHPKDAQNPYVDYTADSLYEFLAKQTLIRSLETKYLYSNLGVGLLGHALSLRAGSSYEKLVVDDIAAPLGLSDTRVTLSDEQRVRLAQGHDADGKPVPNWDFAALAGAGALRSTATDMLRFLAANIDPPEALSRAIRISHEIHRPTAPLPGSIALGWHVKPDGKTYWHNGGTAGHSTYISFNAERKIGVVVLLNVWAAPGQWMDRLGAALESVLAGEQAQPFKIRRTVAVDPKVLETYVGTYESPTAVRGTIRLEGDHLSGQVTGQPELRFYPESQTEFFCRMVDVQLTFTRDDQDRVTGLVLHQGGRDIGVNRVR